MGRSRGGLTTKIHVVVDTNGLPVRLALTAGQTHDNRLVPKLLSRLKSGTMLLADRGYGAEWIRWLATEMGVWANIPPRCNRNEPSSDRNTLRQARSQLPRIYPACVNTAMAPR
jgi:transposase